MIGLTNRASQEYYSDFSKSLQHRSAYSKIDNWSWSSCHGRLEKSRVLFFFMRWPVQYQSKSTIDTLPQSRNTETFFAEVNEFDENKSRKSLPKLHYALNGEIEQIMGKMD